MLKRLERNIESYILPFEFPRLKKTELKNWLICFYFKRARKNQLIVKKSGIEKKNIAVEVFWTWLPESASRRSESGDSSVPEPCRDVWTSPPPSSTPQSSWTSTKIPSLTEGSPRSMKKEKKRRTAVTTPRTPGMDPSSPADSTR